VSNSSRATVTGVVLQEFDREISGSPVQLGLRIKNQGDVLSKSKLETRDNLGRRTNRQTANH
jgi:hypothetical protein